MANEWGYDDGRGVVIGGEYASGSLHRYDTGKQQGQTFYGDTDEDVTKKATQWFQDNGGKEMWPAGLELRIR